MGPWYRILLSIWHEYFVPKFQDTRGRAMLKVFTSQRPPPCSAVDIQDWSYIYMDRHMVSFNMPNDISIKSDPQAEDLLATLWLIIPFEFSHGRMV